MQLYKADGNLDGAYTLYAETEDSIYCQIHYPSGDTGDVYEVDHSIERIKGQFGAKPISQERVKWSPEK